LKGENKMGKSVQERMEELQAEMATLKILEDQEKIREELADKIALKERLFLSLIDQPTICRMPITSDARFKTVFNSEICNQETCYFSDTCNQLNGIIRKKGNGRKSSGVKSSGVKNTAKIKRTVSTGNINLKGNGIDQDFSGNDWKSATKKIRDYFKENPISGLTTSAIAGFTHKGKDQKYEKAFNG
jgi:hypothetical protein